ncbi:hypothetical protein PQX77_017752, partial [Marasmius sp. AFHP31]
NFKVTAVPYMTVGPRRVRGWEKNRSLGHSGSPPTTYGGGMDSQVLARLDMIMERIARLEEADRERDREEAPPDYTSNRLDEIDD